MKKIEIKTVFSYSMFFPEKIAFYEKIFPNEGVPVRDGAVSLNCSA